MTDNKFKTALNEIESLIEKANKQTFGTFTPFLTVDKKTIQVEGEWITDGAKVLVGASTGARSTAPDGTYTLEDGTEIIVQDGIVAKFTPSALAVPPAPVEVQPPAPTPTPEPVLETAMAEEQLADGTMIFVEPIGENEWVGGAVYKVGEDGMKMDELLEDGEYTLADGKKIRIEAGKIAEVMEAEPQEEIATVVEEMKKEFSEFKALLEDKQKELDSVKSEFAAYRETTTQLTEKTFELVSKMAALPAVESPSARRGLKKDLSGEKARLANALKSIKNPN